MSNKKEKEVVVATPENQMELNADVVSNQGSVGKTIFSIALATYLRQKGQVAVFTLDNNNQELSNVLGNKAAGKSVPPKDDDPLTGVGYYDYRTNAQEGIRTVRKFKGINVVRDNPADSIDHQSVMGDFAEQVESLKDMNKKAVYFVMGSSMKCPKSYVSLNNLLKSADELDYGNIEIVSVLNYGMLKATNQVESFNEAYNQSKAVESLKQTGKFHELFIKTKLEEKDALIMKQYTLEKIHELEETFAVNEDGEYIVDYLSRKNIDRVYKEIFTQLDTLIPILTK